MKSLILFLALCATPALWADIEPIHFDAPAAPAPAAPAAQPAGTPADAGAAKSKKPAKRHTKTRHAKKAPAAKQGT
jgi:hypothetical protein